jgi:putative membrane protein
MKSVIKFIKGGLIGIGNILPGISGSMIAVILNIYNELIEALNSLFTHPIVAIKSIWQYAVGAIIGILFGLIVIDYLLGVAPLPITILFVGFIIGAIPTLYKQIHKKTLKWHHFVVFGVSAMMMLSVLFLKENQGSFNSFWYHVSVVLVGVIYAIAMIIPGLSGATMLIAFGFYQILLDMVSSFKDALVSLDFDAFFSQMPLLLLLALGAIVGLIIMGKVMAVFMKKFPEHFISAVLGIVIVSPINILVLLQRETATNVFNVSWYIYVLCILAFAVGVILTLALAKYNIKEVGESND